MKLAISNIAWSQSEDLLMYEALKSLGINGLEIAPTRLFQEPYSLAKETLVETLNSFEFFNIKLVSMQSILFGQSQRIFESDESVDHYIKVFKNLLFFADVMKIPVLVFGSPSLRTIENDEEYDRSIRFFKTISKMCDSYHINIALEANPTIYNTNFINTTSEAIEYSKKINHMHFGINLDLGTVIQNEEDLDLIINSDNISLIKHVHISEPYLKLIDYTHHKLHCDLFKLLSKHNYMNYVSVEMKSGNSIEDIVFTLKTLKSMILNGGDVYEY